MKEKGDDQVDPVLGNHEIPVRQICVRLHGPNENIEPARGNPEMEALFVPGPVRELDELFEEGILHENLPRFQLHLGQGIFSNERLQAFDGGFQVGFPAVSEHVQLDFVGGISHLDEAAEPIPLRFRKGKGPMVFDRVLRGDDEVVPGEFVFDPRKGNFPFFHALQERALGLRVHPVDLVDEHELIENRALPDGKRFLPEVVDFAAENVLRQAVRGPLDARKRVSDQFGERFRDGGFPDAGEVLDEDVPVDEQGDFERPRHLRLMEDEGEERGFEVLEFLVDQGVGGWKVSL